MAKSKYVSVTVLENSLSELIESVAKDEKEREASSLTSLIGKDGRCAGSMRCPTQEAI